MDKSSLQKDEEIKQWNTRKAAMINNLVPEKRITQCTKCCGRGYYANVNREGYLVALYCRCMDDILTKAKCKNK